uniref:F-box domain-containing protein n=1 Tax=Heterorhabditis bacteriophora TaxID=37862 RepID=A0A1I7X4C6_HETBA
MFDMRRFKHALERELHDGVPEARTLLLKTCLRVSLVKVQQIIKIDSLFTYQSFAIVTSFSRANCSTSNPYVNSRPKYRSKYYQAERKKMFVYIYIHIYILQNVKISRSQSITSDYDSNKEHFDSGSWSSTNSRCYKEGDCSNSSPVTSEAELCFVATESPRNLHLSKDSNINTQPAEISLGTSSPVLSDGLKEIICSQFISDNNRTEIFIEPEEINNIELESIKDQPVWKNSISKGTTKVKQKNPFRNEVLDRPIKSTSPLRLTASLKTLDEERIMFSMIIWFPPYFCLDIFDLGFTANLCSLSVRFTRNAARRWKSAIIGREYNSPSPSSTNSDRCCTNDRLQLVCHGIIHSQHTYPLASHVGRQTAQPLGQLPISKGPHVDYGGPMHFCSTPANTPLSNKFESSEPVPSHGANGITTESPCSYTGRGVTTRIPSILA